MVKSTRTPRKRQPARRRYGALSSIVKASLTVCCLFLTYCILLPLATAAIVPCLTNHPFTSYTNTDCTVERGLAWFLRLALTGLGVLTIGFLVFMKRYLNIPKPHTYAQWKRIPSRHLFIREFAPVAVTALAMSITAAIAFLLYIPSVEQAVRNAPILLDTFSGPTPAF